MGGPYFFGIYDSFLDCTHCIYIHIQSPSVFGALDRNVSVELFGPVRDLHFDQVIQAAYCAFRDHYPQDI